MKETKEPRNLFKAWKYEYDRAEAQKENLDTEIKRCELQIKGYNLLREKVDYPFWADAIVKPLAEQLCRDLKGADYDKEFVPMGLNSRVHILIYSNEIDNESNRIDKKKTLVFIGIVPRHLHGDDCELAITDYHTIAHDYPEGSIAEMNGDQYATIKIESYKTLLDYAKKLIKEKRTE